VQVEALTGAQSTPMLGELPLLWDTVGAWSPLVEENEPERASCTETLSPLESLSV